MRYVARFGDGTSMNFQAADDATAIATRPKWPQPALVALFRLEHPSSSGATTTFDAVRVWTCPGASTEPA